MYLTYDYQSSHEGYIDFEFKELHDTKPKSGYSVPLNVDELYDAVLQGYCYEGKAPKYMSKVFECEGDLKGARVSRRLVKKWCENA